MRLISKAVAAVVVMGCSMLAPGVRASEVEDLAIAERMEQLADRYGASTGAAAYRESLYQAAGRLAEKEIRYRRERFAAATVAADSEAALATLLEWRKLEPQSVYVQMRLVGAYADRLQTLDAKVTYLKQVGEAESVDPQVRSQAMTHLARLYLEQSRVQQALETLRKAVLLNGLNVDAMTLQWQLSQNGANQLQRISLLLSLLKADPASVEAAIKVAEDLSRAGLVQQSLQWYGQANNMARPLNGLLGTAPAAARDYAAELLIAGQDRVAGEITARLLERDSSDPGAWFLTLLAERDMKDRIGQVRKSAQIGLQNRLAAARQAIGVRGATTRPLGTEELDTPDLSGDGELLKKATPQQINDYASALADLGWFHAWQGTNAVDATPYINALKVAMPQDVNTLARLEGWVLLRTGRLDEARVKLSAIYEKDPLAALGLVRVLRQDPSAVKEATDLARQLRTELNSRWLGALVAAELGDFGGEIPPTPMADAIRDVLDRFPGEAMKAGTNPGEYLTLRLQPQKVGHDYAEPILVEVEFRNMQQIPLVLGPAGMARDVWIDVQTRGLTNQWVSGVDFQKLDGPMILQPGTTWRYVTRLDRGPLADVLERGVQQAMQMSVFGLTNATPTNQEIGAGTCGIRGRMAQMIERRASSLALEGAMKKARGVVDGNDPAAKLRLVDQVVAHLRLVADPAGPADVKALDAELKDLLIRLSQDSSAAVRIWTRFRMGQMGVEAEEKTLADLAADSLWYGRVLAAIASSEVPDTERTRVLGILKQDPDATVRAAAKSLPAAMAAKSQRDGNPMTAPTK